MMTTITKEQALCIFFCEKYTEHNAQILMKELDSYKEVELCYQESPFEPELRSTLTTYGAPHRYQLYPCTIDDRGTSNSNSTS